MDCLEELSSWFQRCGGYVHPSIELYYDTAKGVHVRRKCRAAAIPLGTKIVDCPHQLTLSALNALGVHPSHSTRNSPFPESFLRNARPQAVGAAFLAQQQLLGEKSFWAPYINTLPGQKDKNELTTALYFDDADLRWIQGTNVEKGAADLEGLWKTEWEHWGGVVQEAFEADRLHCTWDLFKWAMTMFGSRAFPSHLLTDSLASASAALTHRDPDVLLFPFVDAFNHSPTTSNTWQHNTTSFSLFYNEPPPLAAPVTYATVDATTAAAADLELFNSYGAKTNDQLLLSWGFALPHNPDDAFALKLKPTPNPLLTSTLAFTPLTSATHAFDPENGTFYIRRAGHAQRAGYPEEPPHLKGVPVALVNTLATLLASADEAEFIGVRAEELKGKVGAGQLLELGLGNRMAVVQLLVDRLRVERARLVEVGVKGREPTNKRQKWAEVYRMGQVEVLDEVVGLLEEWMLSVEERFQHEEESLNSAR